jgi:hypothetical protein
MGEIEIDLSALGFSSRKFHLTLIRRFCGTCSPIVIPAQAGIIDSGSALEAQLRRQPFAWQHRCLWTPIFVGVTS